ncbi:MAG: shikimate dehydrogenase [Flaviaesturariibacter sp.]|nr:shikimate dehydrogenase [Flaviaesturariibacter sp.]
MKLYGLIGKTLSHSFSKGFFAEKFAATGVTDCAYENFELPSIDALQSLLDARQELCGLNVTIPYKEMVLPFLNEQTPAVKAIGACNCIKIENGKLTGYNTDAPGFKATLEPRLKAQHTHALVFGSGGASKAIQYILEELRIAYKVVSRKEVTGQLGYENIDDVVLEKYKLLINTTPLGMSPNVDNDPPIPYEYLTPEHLLYDVIYNPAETKFLRKGRERGAATCNGHEMLVNQAEESWRIWNNGN